MGVLEIILLAGGAILSIVSFIMPERGSELEQLDPQLTKKQIKDMIDDQLKDVKDQVSDLVEETSQYSVEKTERALERITNEKITAVSEYSDTVMEDIHKSHEEVMFLYDMLNTKHEDLKDVASSVSASVKEARVAKEELSEASREAKETIQAEELREKHQPGPKSEDEDETGDETEAEDNEPEGEVFHSEAARDFFAKHEESRPTIDDIRASFQPMAFKAMRIDENEERVFGNPPLSENEEEDEELTNGADNGKELSQLDDESMDAAIDELLGVAKTAGTEIETATETAAATVTETVTEEDIDAILAGEPEEKTKHNGLDTEAQMDAALRALQKGDVASENIAALADDGKVALENSSAGADSGKVALENAASGADAGKVALENAASGDDTGKTAMENAAAAEDKAAVGLENDGASSDVFGQLKESIYAVVKENDEAGKNAPEEEKPKSIKTIDIKEKKPRSKKSSRSDVDLMFRMDEEDSSNHNERILKLHKKGKSNIAIARELGLGVGEVKLVIDLFKDK